MSHILENSHISTALDQVEIVRLYKDTNAKLADIVRATGHSHYTVVVVLQKAGLKKQSLSLKYDRVEMIRLRLDEKMTVKDIAHKLDCSRSTVSLLLQKAKIKSGRYRG